MNPFDATHVAGLLSETRSRLDVDEPGAWHSAITPGLDLLVTHTRPIVADLRRLAHGRRARRGDDRLGAVGPRLAMADEHRARAGCGERVERAEVALAVCRRRPGNDSRARPARVGSSASSIRWTPGATLAWNMK